MCLLGTLLALSTLPACHWHHIVLSCPLPGAMGT